MVRISPNEVHLSDPENYDKIYNVGTKFVKDPAFYAPMEAPVATPILLTILSLDEHRLRRKMITPFFSRKSVLDVEDMVWTKANKLCGIMQSHFDASPPDTPFEAYKAVRAVAVDVITEYAYAHCWDSLDKADYGMWLPEAIHAVQSMFPTLQALPALIPLFKLIPDWVKVFIFPAFKKWNDNLEVRKWPTPFKIHSQPPLTATLT